VDPRDEPPQSHVAVGRATVIVIVAIVLGVLLLRVGTRAPAALSVATTTLPTHGTVTTTSRPQVTTTTASAAATDRSRVTVLVANDSTVNGVAASYSAVLQRAGWNVLTPVTAKPPVRATSSVYYATGQQAHAEEVAASLGVSSGAVLPVSSSTPVTSTGGADVVVVIGGDLASKTPSTVPTTTTTRPRAG
jgi:hypothetical protein